MRAGLVGYGKGGRYFHATLISSLPGATFAGVVTRSPERKQDVAKDHPGVATFDTLAELVATGVDVVVISTPLASRRALILEALELGVAVVSDKPFAHDAAQARELVEAAEKRGLLLSVYQNRRWDSDFLTVRKLIDSQALGEISRFESSIERYSPRWRVAFRPCGRGAGPHVFRCVDPRQWRGLAFVRQLPAKQPETKVSGQWIKRLLQRRRPGRPGRRGVCLRTG